MDTPNGWLQIPVKFLLARAGISRHVPVCCIAMLTMLELDVHDHPGLFQIVCVTVTALVPKIPKSATSLVVTTRRVKIAKNVPKGISDFQSMVENAKVGFYEFFYQGKNVNKF